MIFPSLYFSVNMTRKTKFKETLAFEETKEAVSVSSTSLCHNIFLWGDAHLRSTEFHVLDPFLSFYFYNAWIPCHLITHQ